MTIAGLIRPDRGSVWLDGRDATRLTPHRRSVAMMFQNDALYPHMPIGRNLAVGDVISTDQRERIARLLGVGSMLDRYPHQLSGGQRRRAALAAVLCRRAAVRLIDEPFSGLDRDGEDRLIADWVMAGLNPDATTVVVTHRLDNAVRIADRIAVIDSGKVLQCGTIGTLRQSPVHRKVFETVTESSVVSIDLSRVDDASVEPPLLLRPPPPPGATWVSFEASDCRPLMRRSDQGVSLDEGLILLPHTIASAGPNHRVLWWNAVQPAPLDDDNPPINDDRLVDEGHDSASPLLISPLSMSPTVMSPVMVPDATEVDGAAVYFVPHERLLFFDRDNRVIASERNVPTITS